MSHDNGNAALVLPMGVETAPTETVSSEAPRMVKCKPGQGKLNRMIAKAQAALSAMGHDGKRFKRDYANGTATYTCPHCQATAAINIADKSMVGSALDSKCSNQAVSNG